jgi:hypothetical protein
VPGLLLSILIDGTTDAATCFKIATNHLSARVLFYYWAVREMGYTATQLAEKLNRTVAGVVYAIRRGEKLAKQRDLKLLEC